jgi:hypothetical protein
MKRTRRWAAVLAAAFVAALAARPAWAKTT